MNKYLIFLIILFIVYINISLSDQVVKPVVKLNDSATCGQNCLSVICRKVYSIQY